MTTSTDDCVEVKACERNYPLPPRRCFDTGRDTVISSDADTDTDTDTESEWDSNGDTDIDTNRDSNSGDTGVDTGPLDVVCDDYWYKAIFQEDGQILDLIVVDNTIYIAFGRGGLAIFDASGDAAEMIGRVDTGGTAIALAVAPGHVYVLGATMVFFPTMNRGGYRVEQWLCSNGVS